jgi:Ca2+-binding RTX toxin-like protein
MALIDISDDLTTKAGETITVPILVVDSVSGLLSADIQLNYPTQFLNATAVRAGSLINGFTVTPNINDAAGIVNISSFGTNGVSGNGTLVEIDFAIDPNATPIANLLLDLVTVSLNEGGIPVTLDDGFLTITGLPTLSINDVSVTEGDSGTQNATFTVTLSKPATETITVKYATANDTATTGDNDYTAANGTLTFAVGQTKQTITVPVKGDTKVEPNETFLVNLSDPTKATIADAQGIGTIKNDDLPTLSIDDVSINEGNDGTTNATFTVTLSEPVDQPVTVDFATKDGTATIADNDYNAASGTLNFGNAPAIFGGFLTFAVGETTKTISVEVNGDTKAEQNETFSVNLSNAQGATIADGQGIGTIKNDDLPTLSIDDVQITEGNSGTKNATFTVTRTGTPTGTITVKYSTADDTATTADNDYTAKNGTLTFATNQTTRTFTVPIVGDTKVEPNETFLVKLSDPTNATIADGDGIGTITNDDSPTLSINDVTVKEGNDGTTNATFTVTLSGPVDQAVTVDFATKDGTATLANNDYKEVKGTLTFPVGETKQEITVEINGDTVNEPNETFFVNLSGAMGGVTIADTQGLGTITNDDGPPPQQIITPVPEIQEVGKNAVVSIEIEYTTSDGDNTLPAFGFRLHYDSDELNFNSFSNLFDTGLLAEGEPEPDTENFDNDSNTDTFINVAWVDVQGNWPNQPLPLTLYTSNFRTTANFDGTRINFSSNNTAAGYEFDSTSAIINYDDGGGGGGGDDDDNPVFSINNVTVTEGDNGITNAVFTVTRTGNRNGTVRVDYTTADATAFVADNDYKAVDGTLTFGNNETTKTITVEIIGDTKIEPNETFFVNLSNPSGATIADKQGVGTITNDDTPQQPSFSINDVEITEGNDGTTNATFTVTLTGDTNEPVTVEYATADGTATTADNDYTDTKGTLVFAPNEKTQTVTVEIIGDTKVEPDETFFVNLSNPTGATIEDNQGIGTIVNDDTPQQPSLSIDDVQVTEGNDGTTNATFTVTLTGDTNEAVTVEYATGDNTATTADNDYTATNGSLTFAPGETTKQVTVEIIGDTNVEPDESFFVNLNNATGATIEDNQGVGTIVNDDATLLPSLSIDDVQVTEGNDGTKLATFTVSLTGDTNEAVTVQYATGDDTATTADNDYTAANGTLTFAPGETTKQVTVEIIGDTKVEPDETFFVNLSNATGATISDNQGIGTIVDDDAVELPSLSINGATVLEEDGSVTLTVTLSQASSETVSVNYTTANQTALAGEDYNSGGATLTFAPGETSKEITIGIIDNDIPEGEETFLVNLSNPSNANILDGEGVVTIASDNNLFNGTSGNDSLTAYEGDDTINGSSGNDTVYGNQNNDFLFGEGGSDVIYGGQNNDLMEGDTGDDTLNGNKGDDTIRGQDDNDVIYGNQNNDNLFGDAGNDLIYGGQDNDTMEGGTGDDTLYGNKADDRIFGNDGNDRIYGGQGKDVVEGGAGNDTISGNMEDDTLTGGEGADVFRYEFGFEKNVGFVDYLTDFVSAVDKISLSSGVEQVLEGLTLSTSTVINFNSPSSFAADSITEVFSGVSPNFLGSSNSTLQVGMLQISGGSLNGDTYLFVNNGLAGGQEDQDLLIKVNTILNSGDLIIA